MLKPHFRRAHADENICVNRYWKEEGGQSLRTPISGAGQWKGDVFTILPNVVRYELVRRASLRKCSKCKGEGVLYKTAEPQRYEPASLGRDYTCPKCNGKGKIGSDTIIFFMREIQDIYFQAIRTSILLPTVKVEVCFVAHFLKARKWVKKCYLELLPNGARNDRWNKGDVEINAV